MMKVWCKWSEVCKGSGNSEQRTHSLCAAHSPGPRLEAPSLQDKTFSNTQLRNISLTYTHLLPLSQLSLTVV